MDAANPQPSVECDTSRRTPDVPQNSGDAHPTASSVPWPRIAWFTATPPMTHDVQSSGDTHSTVNISPPPGLSRYAPPDSVHASQLSSGEGDSATRSATFWQDSAARGEGYWTAAATSGDAHPTHGALPDFLLTEIVASSVEYQDVAEDVRQYVQEIAETAAKACPTIKLAAQSLLAQIYLNDNVVRDQEQVLAVLAEPIRRRRAYVSVVATRRGVAQHAADQGYGYTPQQWAEWYENNPLSEHEFQEALKQWKDNFPIHGSTLGKIAEQEAYDKRASKARARRTRGQAFKVHVKDTCAHYPLAMAVLSHPPATVKTLLQSWATYLISPDYLDERGQ